MMNVRRIPLVLFSTLSIATAAHAGEKPEPAQMQVHDLANQFVEVWDRNAGKPEAEFVQDFKASISSRFPEFYNVERYGGKKTEAKRDQEIAAAFTGFPALRDTYVRKAAQFAADLPAHIETFKTAFPDYVPKNDIYFIHSLGEMDGGKRKLNGRSYFIFGADVMAKYHGAGSEAAFFHHELFHDYDASACTPWKIWTALWAEGLATYASKTMNPSATNAELLLDLPLNMVPDTQKELSRAWEHLQATLDKDDSDLYGGLFLLRKDKTGLPARRGYYLGYLVAQEAAKKYDLRQMAKLDCATARDVVFSAVETLRASSAMLNHQDKAGAAP